MANSNSNDQPMPPPPSYEQSFQHPQHFTGEQGSNENNNVPPPKYSSKNATEFSVLNMRYESSRVTQTTTTASFGRSHVAAGSSVFYQTFSNAQQQPNSTWFA